MNKPLFTYSAYDFEGSIKDLIIELNNTIKNNPDARIEYDLDYSHCYYESDPPTVKFIVWPK